MPFYFKKDENWVMIKGPIDIRTDEGKALVSVYHTEDPEKLSIDVHHNADVVVTTGRKDRFYPGQTILVNRDDIFIEDLNTGEKRAIIHSKTPIGMGEK